MPEDSNVVFIGRKPVMNYVLAVMTLLGSGKTNQVTLKARGQAITTAVDVAEITKRRFLENMKVNQITVGTEEVELKEGGKKAVSTIEISLTSQPKSPA